MGKDTYCPPHGGSSRSSRAWNRFLLTHTRKQRRSLKEIDSLRHVVKDSDARMKVMKAEKAKKQTEFQQALAAVEASKKRAIARLCMRWAQKLHHALLWKSMARWRFCVALDKTTERMTDMISSHRNCRIKAGLLLQWRSAVVQPSIPSSWREPKRWSAKL